MQSVSDSFNDIGDKGQKCTKHETGRLSQWSQRQLHPLVCLPDTIYCKHCINFPNAHTLLPSSTLEFSMIFTYREFVNCSESGGHSSIFPSEKQKNPKNQRIQNVNQSWEAGIIPSGFHFFQNLTV